MKLEQLTEAKKDENSDLNKTPPPGKLGQFITTSQAARILKVTASRVRQFIMDGRLKSYSPEKGRRDNMLKLSEVRAFAGKEREPTGRPSEQDKNEDKKPVTKE